jgi:hypothetical protein
MNQTIKYGVFAGIGTIAYYLLFFVSNKELIFTPAVIWSSMLVSVLCMYLCGKKILTKDIQFQDILRTVFLVWVIAELMFYLWYYRFYNADASISAIQSKVMIDTYQNLLTQTQDMAQAQMLRATISDLQQNPLTLTFKEAFIGLGRGLVGGFGIAYAITYFLDKKMK